MIQNDVTCPVLTRLDVEVPVTVRHSHWLRPLHQVQAKARFPHRRAPVPPQNLVPMILPLNRLLVLVLVLLVLLVPRHH